MVTRRRDDLQQYKRPLRYLMGVVYVVAGVMHFVAPKAFKQVVPPSLPNPTALVYLSGAAEMLLGVGVLIERTRRESAWGIILLLLAVFPANVYMATGDPKLGIPDWARGLVDVAAWVRLPFQAVLILWAWWHASPDTPAQN